MTIEVWIWISLAVSIGALVQGSLGFGVNVVVAPLVGIIHPDLLPGGLLLLGASMSTTVLLLNRHHLQLKSLRWAILGRVPGTGIGVSIVVIATQNQLGIACGITVLLAVVVIAKGNHIPSTPRNLIAGGFVSGVMGAATAIGGPPIAMVLMAEEPRSFRATMSAFLAFGTSLAVLMLALAGKMAIDDVLQVATLAPALILGTMLSRVVAPHLHPARTRYAVLGLSTLGAFALLAKSITNAL